MKFDFYFKYNKLIPSLMFLLLMTGTYYHVHANILYVNVLDITCNSHAPCYPDIQSAIEAASPGDTVLIQNGTYNPTGMDAIEISKSITVLGESETGVVINASSLFKMGIYITSDNVTLKNFTIQQAPAFGIVNKAGVGDGLTVENVSSNDNLKSGIGIRNLTGATFKDITLMNNQGNGLSLTSVQNVTIEGITTSGNQFQKINGFTAAIGIFSTEDGITSNVSVTGSFIIYEPVGIYVEPGPLSGNYLINPPLNINQITISDSLNAAVGVDVDIVPNAAQTDIFFGTVAGADAIYYFKDLVTASECASAAARLNYDAGPGNATPATNGILEPYLFLYDLENDELLYLPIITEDPEDALYGCVGDITFTAAVDPRSTDPTGFWEASDDNGLTWNTLAEGNVYVGVDSTTLTVDSVFLELDGMYYRYISQNDYGADTSAAAVLTVPEACFLCQNEPTLHCPANTTVLCTTDNFQHVIAPQNLGMATAESNCQDVDIDTIYYSDQDLRTQPCLTGDIIRTWYAVDAVGNMDSCIQTITVIDTLAPVLTVSGGDTLPADTVYETCNPFIPEPPQVIATDNCGAVDPVTYQADTVQGDCEENYTIHRTWSATDACGNIGTYTQKIRVVCEPEVQVCELINWSTEPNPFNHGIYLFQSPLDPDMNSGIDTEAQRFVWDTSDPNHLPQLLTLPEGDTAVATGIVKSRLDDNAKFEVMLIFVNPISGTDFRGEFVADNPQALAVAQENVDDWTLWRLSDESKLIGKGNIQGTLHLSHAPADYSKLAQVGVGGNAKDGDLGIASWFHFEGDLIYDGNNVSLNSQGDINADIASCDTICRYELPTVVSQLDGNLSSDNLIQLSWGTYMEGPNEIIVEKSLDGQLFTQVDTIHGSENNISPENSSYFDTDVAGSDVLYYRLKVSRPDGSVVYTNVVAVYVGDPGKHFYEVYPNPVEDHIYVRAINPVEGIHHYRIVDSRGRVVNHDRLDVDYVYRIDVSDLNAGFYFFQVIRPDGEYLIKRLSVRH